MNKKIIAVIVSIMLSPAAMAQDKATLRQWKSKCSSCHGADGKGQTEKGKKMKVRDMTTPEYQKTKDSVWKNAILDGVKSKDGTQVMDGYREDLSEEQVDNLVKLIRSFGS